MAKAIISLLIGCTIFLLPINGQNYNEKYRLQVHYSVPSGWMNDPNGLIYEDGYYHLFYQYNPASTTFGPPHWGHAQSLDLVHWENLPIAIYPYNEQWIFSGCCVLDKDNVTGFGSHLPGQSEQPLIAIYTLHEQHGETHKETQGLSYSLDKGMTWTYYDANPIIPSLGIPDFRDPNVFERNGTFYMVLAEFDRIEFFKSKNLINWEPISKFGVDPMEGSKDGVWECPSLFSLKDEQNNEHDVLVVSENIPNSAIEYFIGKFDGVKFNTYNKSRSLRLDFGHDNFAAVPYVNDPFGRIIMVSWMSNWNYSLDTPTSTWRGQMTIPRELKLKTVDGSLYLVQRLVDDLYSLIDGSRQWSLSTPYHLLGNQNINLSSLMPFKTGSMLILEYAINIENIRNGEIGIKFGNNLGESVLFHYNVSSDTYVFDRRKSGNVTFNTKFADQIAKAKRISTSKCLSGQILLDTASIEVFADDGLSVFTSLFFPTEPYENIELIFDTADKSATVEKLSVSALHSIWT
ncbi:uncharacterized protein LOC116344402 [Contarinia nasturtii]|uniref:uncharacterized protein LOC116344402 n=1 Tax=Contarinia nasturtii TaxID=265458 RepID=UPI0012D423EF|nr:uncharacterized protein LOC116344402 [Contarinia nasturtii]